MNRITEIFTGLRATGGKALIPYITAGDPDLATTRQLVLKLQQAGADLIELGVPFSDPVADGPTIQRASLRALGQGTSLCKILGLVRDIRRRSTVPLVLMSYYNPIFILGPQAFVEQAAAAGVDGLIVPDLTPEEATPLRDACQAHRVALIFLLAPTSSRERMRLVDRMTSGFIYGVSLTGVTGARESLAEGITDFVAAIRAVSQKPLAIGFGISNPEQAQSIGRLADGVIVGSAIINVMEKHLGQPDLVGAVGEFVASLRQALDQDHGTKP